MLFTVFAKSCSSSVWSVRCLQHISLFSAPIWISIDNTIFLNRTSISWRRRGSACQLRVGGSCDSPPGHSRMRPHNGPKPVVHSLQPFFIQRTRLLLFLETMHTSTIMVAKIIHVVTRLLKSKLNSVFKSPYSTQKNTSYILSEHNFHPHVLATLTSASSRFHQHTLCWSVQRWHFSVNENIVFVFFFFFLTCDWYSLVQSSGITWCMKLTPRCIQWRQRTDPPYRFHCTRLYITYLLHRSLCLANWCISGYAYMYAYRTCTCLQKRTGHDKTKKNAGAQQTLPNINGQLKTLPFQSHHPNRKWAVWTKIGIRCITYKGSLWNMYKKKKRKKEASTRMKMRRPVGYDGK